MGEISIKAMTSVLLIVHERGETLLSRVNQLNTSSAEEAAEPDYFVEGEKGARWFCRHRQFEGGGMWTLAVKVRL